MEKIQVYILGTKVVVMYYLRLRNEFQLFPAKKPGLLLVGLLRQRPGVWREMDGIHFSISDN